MPDESRKPLTRPDPRSPFVIDTHELGRRPGSMRAEARTVRAPADLGIELVGALAGAEIELDIRLEAVMEGVLFSGTARVPLTGECARCLDPLASVLEVEFQELFVYADTRSGDNADDDERRLEGELLDFEPVLRDSVVTELPLSPVCREDCPGLCAQCGVRLAEAGPGHRHESADPRWAVLEGMFDEDDKN